MRYAWIEEHRDAFGIARMCGLLKVSRSGYCQWRGRAPSDRARSNAALDAAVSKLHAVSRRSYGRPRIVRSLCKQGFKWATNGCAGAFCDKACVRCTGARIE